MTDSTARRRGHGEDAVYFDAAKNRYVGAVSLGFGPDGKRNRRKVSGRTKQEVRDKLKALHAELDRGLRTSSTYTVQKGHCCVVPFLRTTERGHGALLAQMVSASSSNATRNR